MNCVRLLCNYNDRCYQIRPVDGTLCGRGKVRLSVVNLESTGGLMVRIGGWMYDYLLLCMLTNFSAIILLSK